MEKKGRRGRKERDVRKARGRSWGSSERVILCVWGAGYTRFSHSHAPTHEVLPKEVRKWRGCGREVERARAIYVQYVYTYIYIVRESSLVINPEVRSMPL